ncbi:MAG: nucleotide excision repair endonuclease [Chromatocurvus sp.]
MRPRIENASLTRLGKPIDELPDCAGVYRFVGEDGQLLYVGKSIDIRTRVLSHYTAARQPGRQQRMMHSVVRVDCEPCTGELGALLRENAAIKREIPLYNRRQRRRRHLWTLTLVAGSDDFLKVKPQQLLARDALASDSYGLYHSASHGEDTLRQLARDRGLCLRVLGFEHGRGPCFAHQLRRCLGACAGVETAADHNSRLRDALLDQRILAWPFPAAVLLRESIEHKRPGQPKEDWHVVDQWRYIGSYARRQHAAAAALKTPAQDADNGADKSMIFDRDAYVILLRALRSQRVDIHSADSLNALQNPLRPDLSAA